MRQNIDQSHIYTVGELTVTREQVPPGSTVSAVYDIFSASPSLEALAIVEGDRPLGLITRTKLLFKLSRRFGYELHAKHPIITVADTVPLVV